MKSFLAGCGIAALGALAAAPADAQEAPPARPPTRAEVTAELLRARAAGELDFTLMPVLREPAAPRAVPAAMAPPERPAAAREARGALPPGARLADTR